MCVRGVCGGGVVGRGGGRLVVVVVVVFVVVVVVVVVVVAAAGAAVEFDVGNLHTPSLNPNEPCRLVRVGLTKPP